MLVLKVIETKVTIENASSRDRFGFEGDYESESGVLRNTLTLYLKIESSLIFVNKHVSDVAHCLQLLKCLLRRECAHLTKRHQYIFSISLKFGEYYIMDQLGEVIKNVT